MSAKRKIKQLRDCGCREIDNRIYLEAACLCKANCFTVEVKFVYLAGLFVSQTNGHYSIIGVHFYDICHCKNLHVPPMRLFSLFYILCRLRLSSFKPSSLSRRLRFPLRRAGRGHVQRSFEHIANLCAGHTERGRSAGEVQRLFQTGNEDTPPRCLAGVRSGLSCLHSSFPCSNKIFGEVCGKRKCAAEVFQTVDVGLVLGLFQSGSFEGFRLWIHLRNALDFRHLRITFNRTSVCHTLDRIIQRNTGSRKSDTHTYLL
nr:MAG TPA: hypothetical protein [Caudoviricetes sp.]